MTPVNCLIAEDEPLLAAGLRADLNDAFADRAPSLQLADSPEQDPSRGGHIGLGSVPESGRADE